MGRIRTFAEFVADDDPYLRSEWTVAVYPTATLEIYVRRCIRWRGAYEIGNIKARKRGKGTFTTFLAEWNDKIPLLVENVHNPKLAEYLARNGWRYENKNGWDIYCNDKLQELMDG